MSVNASARAEYKRLWYQANKERIRPLVRKNQSTYYQRHKAERRDKQKVRYHAHGHLDRMRKRVYPPPTRPCPEVCECCGSPPKSTKALCLDHDHETKLFRGWLCDRCNRAIGLLGDTLASVEKAVAYLGRVS